MKQRLKLAQAIVHDPEIVFLDEPTNGLDPKGQAQILELVQSLWTDLRHHGGPFLASAARRGSDLRADHHHRAGPGAGARQSGEPEGAPARGGGSGVARTATRNCRRPATRAAWTCELLPNGHVKVEHKAESLNPLLKVLRRVEAAAAGNHSQPERPGRNLRASPGDFPMPVHDTSYQHWDGIHLACGAAASVIAGNGITRCLQIKGMRHLVMVCWVPRWLMTAILFFVGQLLVPDGMVVQWVGNLNPQLQMFARLLTTWLEQHPEISVHTTQNVLFFYFCTLADAREHFRARPGDAHADYPRPGQQCDHHLFIQSRQPRRLSAREIFDGVRAAHQ